MFLHVLETSLNQVSLRPLLYVCTGAYVCVRIYVVFVIKYADTVYTAYCY